MNSGLIRHSGPIGSLGFVCECPKCGGATTMWEGDVSVCLDCGWSNAVDAALNNAKRVLNEEIEPVRRERFPIIVNILGVPYVIRRCNDSSDPRMKDSDSFCDETTREILVETYKKYQGYSNRKKDLSAISKKLIRHEVVRAFLIESGISECSEWARNEEMLEWFSMQGPKIFEAWKTAMGL